MKKIKTYENKKVLVLGLGKSGVNVARLLVKLGALVTVNDAKKLDDNADAQELVSEGVRVITGHHPLELLDENFELMVKNPGIHYDNPMVKRAQEKGIPIITEPELAYEVSEAPMVGITGTNGKTTTTTMIGMMLNEDRKKGHAYLAGNIGIPATEVAQKVTPDDVMVTELSSFQLEGTTQLHPHIAVLMDIYPAHLDFHGSMENYINAKMKIVQNQTADDYFVLNWDEEKLRPLAERTKATVVPFSRTDQIETGAYEKDGVLYFRGDAIMKADDVRVPGPQNIDDALAALSVAKLGGQTNDAIKAVLTSFSGVKHRLQFVTEYQGRKFYNDSKSTNNESTIVAMNAFNQPEILLAGGLDRHISFDSLVAPMKKHVKAVVLWGETAEKLKQTAVEAGITNIQLVKNAGAAVPAAYQVSEPGDVIVLSPACASWDQYVNMEQRGDEYIAAIDKLTGGKA
ncbi:murD protein [Lactobacillus selangorensis]|uniref:UDP-N-acetylmuramoylalanine--D-glutamate ligase n=1 Tax=Lactobacillus selangorensis TaxID=81857 RepID=A0A0R2G1F7_9LACO|nr:UDP-N-acetylmuramoyl-L-alanine--D-glutamate ligase [Lactobacillus selangorensis]KRN29361.1 murD protein [Lactobacillus selangorensis]KRN34110.1 murD protein [Lactobacillus selangorensis]